MLFYLFDFFKGLLIIPVGCNSCQHDMGVRPAGIKVMINPKSMRITVISDNFSDSVV